MTSLSPIKFGQINATCELCWKTKERFGSLIDPNGHAWLICADCINTWWEEDHALKMEERVNELAKERAITLIQERLLGDG